MRGMVIEMNDEQLRTLADLQGFLDGAVAMDFTVVEGERYAFIARTVKRFGYGRLNRADKAVVLRFLERVSGYSRQQISRLVKRGGERRVLVKRYRGSRHSNDNAQAESKNGAIVRKHLGYSHIPQRFAAPVNEFCRDYTRYPWAKQPFHCKPPR